MTTTNTAPRASFDLSAPMRLTMLIGGVGIGLASAAALGRAALGFAPAGVTMRELAVIVHVCAVLPAVPLGLYVMLTRKGGARHKLLGRVWMLLMLVTALSALFIRHLNGGNFSWIHLFVPLAIVGMARAIGAARQGRIADHRKLMMRLYLGALVLPGLFTFLPGRLMGLWLFG